MLTNLLEISFSPYIPSTLIGLLGLCSGYLYFYFKSKNDNKLDEIKSTSSRDRLKAIELYLNEIGSPIDTTNLDPQDKYKLLVKSLKIKTTRYLIVATVTIIFSLIAGFIIWNKENKNAILNPIHSDSTASKSKAVEPSTTEYTTIITLKATYSKANTLYIAEKSKNEAVFEIIDNNMPVDTRVTPTCVNFYKNESSIGEIKVRIKSKKPEVYLQSQTDSPKYGIIRMTFEGQNKMWYSQIIHNQDEKPVETAYKLIPD